MTCSTAGSARTICSTSLTTSRVRLTEAPWGRLISAMKAPWSSSGRKPVGVTLNSQPVRSPNPATRARTSTENRTSRRTMAA